MRQNLPVTNNEYVLTDNDNIVSKTTPTGVITYVNEDFLRISQFSLQELIGQPQNIVRHPDMPVEAFADFWASMKAGKPWTGVVKNRCKNGDYYWVLANATPIRENGQVTGYMSVRTKPSAMQVAEATKAYQLFKEGKTGNLKIKDGKVVKVSALDKFNLFKSMKLTGRINLAISLLSILLISVGFIGLFGMSKNNEGFQTVYNDRAVPLSQLSRIDTLISANRIAINDIALFPTEENINRRTGIITENSKEIDRIWKAYTNTYLTPEEKALADKLWSDQVRFINEGIIPAIQLLNDKKIDGAKEIIRTRFTKLAEPMDHGIEALITIQTNTARAEYESAINRYEMIQLIAISVIAIGLILALIIGKGLYRAIVNPLKRANRYLEQIAQGNYKNTIEIDHDDETGKLMENMNAMQIRQGFESIEAANGAMRIKVGLDNVSTGAMIVNNNHKIIYINYSLEALFKSFEHDLRKDLPNFNLNNLIGSDIGDFYKEKMEQQKKMLSTLNATHREQIELGGRILAVAYSPIINKENVRLGTIIEWIDRTAEAAVEKEISTIVYDAAHGDFTKRMDLSGKTGFFKALSESMNKLLVTSETSLNEVARVLSALAKGDLTDKITNEYHGTFGQLKYDVNTTVDKLQEIVSQIKGTADNISTATQEIALGNTDLSQRTDEQASSLEETSSSMEELTATVQQNADNARQANQLALGASNVAVKGGEVVGQVVLTMSSINESSKKVVDIISVIDGIAFQTNILALNAAVEAARAGEQGRGFAVVATEVRTLAQRSASAAKEIKELINDSVAKVEDGTRLVDEAGVTMNEIVTAVKRVTDIMGEISAASQEQSTGIGQVNLAVAQMDEVTQQNASLVEEASAAAESLEEEARHLIEYVDIFKLNGAATGTQPHERRNHALRPTNVKRLATRPHAADQAIPASHKKMATAVNQNDLAEF